MSSGTDNFLKNLCDDKNEHFKDLPSCDVYNKIKNGVVNYKEYDSYCENYCKKMCCNVCCYNFFKVGRNECSDDSRNTCEKEYNACQEDICKEKLKKRYKECKGINWEKLMRGDTVCKDVMNEENLVECKKVINNEQLCTEYKQCIEDIDKEKLKDNYIEPCKKICKGVIKLSIILSSETNLRDKCSYFSYWAYKELWNVTNGNSNNKLDPCVSDILQKVIWTINYYDAKDNPCYFYFDEDFNAWKNEKYLHDYFKNCSQIKSNLGESKNDVSKKEEYCKYIGNIAPLYKDYLGYCCTYFFLHGNFWDKCPNFFNCDKQYNPYNMLKELDCKDQLKDFSEGLIDVLEIDRDVIEKSKETRLSRRGRSTEKQEMKVPFRISHPVTTNSLIKDDISLTSDPIYVTILFSYTILGMFFLFFLFYKFTPLGSLINRKTIKKKQMNRNFQENSKRKLPSRKLQQVQGNTRKKRISIAYNSE
ncbi:variable surface protein [Plasmodium gonderi]|uniref:Variable surface protein n=1 Tax=Plasmodium gonderi TaxID=77519 RepID=A0A1Y1JAW6_PLAGO|nr:variable surface protein [Plasmodium gonderi]GAW79400.1 variable surface protein [Plasmodium gonderi]